MGKRTIRTVAALLAVGVMLLASVAPTSAGGPPTSPPKGGPGGVQTMCCGW